MIYILIGLAGSVGAALRYSIGVWMDPFNGVFPFPTLIINLAGCFALAWLMSAAPFTAAISASARSAIGTGFIGSFTTFSALSLETLQLLQHRLLFTAFLYITLSLIGGVAFAWLGDRAGNLQLQKTSRERNEP